MPTAPMTPAQREEARITRHLLARLFDVLVEERADPRLAQRAATAVAKSLEETAPDADLTELKQQMLTGFDLVLEVYARLAASDPPTVPEQHT